MSKPDGIADGKVGFVRGDDNKLPGNHQWLHIALGGFLGKVKANAGAVFFFLACTMVMHLNNKIGTLGKKIANALGKKLGRNPRRPATHFPGGRKTNTHRRSITGTTVSLGFSHAILFFPVGLHLAGAPLGIKKMKGMMHHPAIARPKFIRHHYFVLGKIGGQNQAAEKIFARGSKYHLPGRFQN